MRDFQTTIRKVLKSNSDSAVREEPTEKIDGSDASKKLVLWMQHSKTGKILLNHLINDKGFIDIFNPLSQVNPQKALQILFESPIIQQMILLGDLDSNWFLQAEAEFSYDNPSSAENTLGYFLKHPLCSPYFFYTVKVIEQQKLDYIKAEQIEQIKKHEEKALLISLRNFPTMLDKNCASEPDSSCALPSFSMARALSECIEESLLTHYHSLTLPLSEPEAQVLHLRIYTYLGLLPNFSAPYNPVVMTHWPNSFIENTSKTAACYLIENHFLPPKTLIPLIQKFHNRSIDLGNENDKMDYENLIHHLMGLNIWKTLDDTQKFVEKKGRNNDLNSNETITIEDDLLERVSTIYRSYLEENRLLKNANIKEKYSYLTHFLMASIESDSPKADHAKKFISHCEKAIDGLAVLKNYFDQHDEEISYIHPERLLYVDEHLPTSLFELLVCNPYTLQSLFGFNLNIKKDDSTTDTPIFEFIYNDLVLHHKLAILNLTDKGKNLLQAAYNRLLYRPGSLIFWLCFLNQNTEDNLQILHKKIIQHLSKNRLFSKYVSLTQVLHDLQYSEDQDTVRLVFTFIEKYLETQIQTKQADAYWQTICYFDREKLSNSLYSPANLLSKNNSDYAWWWDSLKNSENKMAAIYFFRGTDFPAPPQMIKEHTDIVFDLIKKTHLDSSFTVDQTQLIQQSDNPILTTLANLEMAEKSILFINLLLYQPETIKFFVTHVDHFVRILYYVPIEYQSAFVAILGASIQNFIHDKNQLVSALNALSTTNWPKLLRFLNGAFLKRIIKNEHDLASVLKELSTEKQWILIKDLNKSFLHSLIQNEKQLAAVLTILPTENQGMFIAALGKTFILNIIQNEHQLTSILKAVSAENQQVLITILGQASIQGFVHNAHQLASILRRLPTTHWSVLIAALGNFIQDHLISNHQELLHVLKRLPSESWPTLINLLNNSFKNVIKNEYELSCILKELPAENWPNLIEPLRSSLQRIINNSHHLIFILNRLPIENQQALITILDKSIQQAIFSRYDLTLVLEQLSVEGQQALITTLNIYLTYLILNKDDLNFVLEALSLQHWPALITALGLSIKNIIPNNRQLLAVLEKLSSTEKRVFLITSLSSYIKELIPNNVTLKSLSDHRNLYNDLKRELGDQIDARSRYKTIWKSTVKQNQSEPNKSVKARLVLSNYILGGSMSRFFAGHWNRTREHLDAVKIALAEISETDDQNTPEGFIRKIHTILSNHDINILERQGSLHRRLVYLADLEGKKLDEIISRHVNPTHSGP